MTTLAADDIVIPFERTRDDQAWARWLARSADALMLAPFVFVAFAVLGGLIEIGRAPVEILEWMENPVLSTLIEVGAMLVLFALWEPLFISNTGTTPGKFILGIRVRRNDDTKLSFPRALSRFLRVWFIGMGASIPLLTLILMLMSRAKLTADGVTGWDEALDVKVEHRKRHPLIWVLVIVVVIGVNVALRILNQMAG